jgi:hypothetical protein
MIPDMVDNWWVDTMIHIQMIRFSLCVCNPRIKYQIEICIQMNFLNVWLLDAMDGPTLIYAPMYAATIY